MAFRKPIVQQSSTHRQLGASDRLTPDSIPVSAFGGNLVKSRDDGLYVGTMLEKPVLYVAANGTDATTRGTKAQPLKTLAYAFNLMNSGPQGYSGTIALRCKDTFDMSSLHQLRGNVVITFYGDSVFGDFDSPKVGQADPAVMETLERPIINVMPLKVDSMWACGGFDVNGYRLSHRGVRVELADVPNPVPAQTDYGVTDYITGDSGTFETFGVIVNRRNYRSYSGLLGIKAQSELVYKQYATQFRVMDSLMDGASDPSYLASRVYFIKFYVDAPGNNTDFVRMSADALSSSAGSGLLKLLWSDVQRLNVASGAYNLNTFPVLSHQSYGFANYVHGLRRDQQSRPLNVITPRLF